jgi:hypothetical protein
LGSFWEKKLLENFWENFCLLFPTLLNLKTGVEKLKRIANNGFLFEIEIQAFSVRFQVIKTECKITKFWIFGHEIILSRYVQ